MRFCLNSTPGLCTVSNLWRKEQKLEVALLLPSQNSVETLTMNESPAVETKHYDPGRGLDSGNSQCPCHEEKVIYFLRREYFVKLCGLKKNVSAAIKKFTFCKLYVQLKLIFFWENKIGNKPCPHFQ